MKCTPEEFDLLIDASYPDNIAQEIDADDTNTVATAFIDSYAHREAPVSTFTFTIISTDLDANLQYTLTHNLGTQVFKAVIFDAAGRRVLNRHYDLTPSGDNSAVITVFSGIAFNDKLKGYIYEV